MSDDHALGLGYRMGDGYTRRPTASIGLGPVRLLWRPRAMRAAAPGGGAGKDTESAFT